MLKGKKPYWNKRSEYKVLGQNLLRVEVEDGQGSIVETSEITKDELRTRFVKTIYEKHGKSWKCIWVYFKDSGNLGYRIPNTKTRFDQREQAISEHALHGIYGKNVRNKIEKEMRKHAREQVYCLLFYTKDRKQAPYIKVGRTYQVKNIFNRLDRYVFPASNIEIERFSDLILDLEHSFFIYSEYRKSSGGSLESEILKKYGDQLYKNGIYKKAKEFFSVDMYPILIKELGSKAVEQKENIVFLKDYSGLPKRTYLLINYQLDTSFLDRLYDSGNNEDAELLEDLKWEYQI